MPVGCLLICLLWAPGVGRPCVRNALGGASIPYVVEHKAHDAPEHGYVGESPSGDYVFQYDGVKKTTYKQTDHPGSGWSICLVRVKRVRRSVVQGHP